MVCVRREVVCCEMMMTVAYGGDDVVVMSCRWLSHINDVVYPRNNGSRRANSSMWHVA